MEHAGETGGRRVSGRERKPTLRAVEGAEQAQLQFNERLIPGQVDRERREWEDARMQQSGWAPQEGDLVWARFDRWPWWPATLTKAEDRPWRKETQGKQFVYNAEFLGHGSKERADYEYLPTAQLRPYRRFRDEMVAQSTTGEHIKWVPSRSSAESSDTLNPDYQGRFDAAVEHADHEGQIDLWPIFYKAKAATEHAVTTYSAGSKTFAPAVRARDHEVGAELRRMLDGLPKHPASQLEHIPRRPTAHPPKDEDIRNQVNVVLRDIIDCVAEISSAAVVARSGVGALRSTPNEAAPRTWPFEQELIQPVSYTDQLMLCLRKRGGLVSDRHKVSARLRLPAEQRASQRKILADWPQPSADSVTDVNQKLRAAFGARTFRPGTEHALNALIGTILTQNTSDILSSRSFSQLHREFDSGIHGPEIRAADIDTIADLLAASGLQNSKARRIRELLRLLHDENQGSVSLEFLKSWPRERIHSYLSRFSGIGVKTIACIGLYNLGVKDFAIDTHIYRFAVRFGWAPTFTYSETLSATLVADQMPLASAQVSPPAVLRLPLPPIEPPPQPDSEARAAKLLAELLDDPSVSPTTTSDGLVEIAATTATAAFSSAVSQPPCETPSNAARDEVQLTGENADATVDYDSDVTEEMDEMDARTRAGVEEDDDKTRSSVVGCNKTTFEQQRTNSNTPKQPAGPKHLDFTTAEAQLTTSVPVSDTASLVNPGRAGASAPTLPQHPISSVDACAASCLDDIEDLGAQEFAASSDRNGPARFMRIPPIVDVQTHILKRFEHANLRTLGMRLCHAKSPRCDICPLSDTCEHGKRVLGREAAQMAGPAARKPKGDASQPWMKFHDWAGEELPAPTKPADQLASSDSKTLSGSNRRVFKGLQLVPVTASDAEHEVCTAFPAVNALCHARGAGDYCQLESWEVCPTAESLQSHRVSPISEQVCLGMQRRVGPATKLRLMAKYFSDRTSSCGATSSADQEYLQADCDATGRVEKVLALSHHDRTSQIEAAHARRIAQKRRTDFSRKVGGASASCDATTRSIRRKLDFDIDQASAPAPAVAICQSQETSTETTAQSAIDTPSVSCPPPFCIDTLTPTTLPLPPCRDITAAVTSIVNEIERRAAAPKLYILTDFFEDISVQPQPASVAADCAGTVDIDSQSETKCHSDQAGTQAARADVDTATDSVRRWVQALRVYHNSDLWAPAGFDNDSNFERNEVWVSMERVLLPIDRGTTLRRRTIDFSTASPPCHNYVCHSMIKPHSRGSTLHGLEEWSIMTGLFTKSKDWHAIHSKWSDSALVLHSHHSHNELRKITGLGHEVKPQPDRPVWIPAAERRRHKRRKAPQTHQQEPQTLPDPWQEHSTSHQDVIHGRSNEAGQPYYYNPITHESRWERPYVSLPHSPLLDLSETGAQAQVKTPATLLQLADLSDTPDVVEPESVPVIESNAEAVDVSTTVPQLVRSKRRQQSLDELLPDHSARASELERAACEEPGAGSTTKKTPSIVHADNRENLKQQKLTDLVASMQCASYKDGVP